ncbi:hemin-degrading factor [Reinekea thalattae]|uniref:Hemin-degrading factor n=1 Tax=Reinekea thalattae TaxID=2593301 RepID=A0A5C8Z2Y4_9GAMM|nr:ChuX/HutX family heme-like substrate-binding protein [Reinekea thalattae]TXR51917.1 hemin-degrading factor [Reinekea thalattae]
MAAKNNTTELQALFDQAPANNDLFDRFKALQEQQPSLRRRDQATALNVSEAELIDSKCDLLSLRLNTNFAEQINQMPSLGYVMTLTRNDHCVHEKKGVYQNVSVNSPHMGLVISDDRKIDLRIMLSRWAYGFAVQEWTAKGLRYSLQYFDATGSAIEKIFLQSEEKIDAYTDFVKQFLADDQTAPLSLVSQLEKTEHIADEKIDVATLSQDWQGMRDVHQLFGILKRHNISREQAFHAVGEPWALPVNPEKLEHFLTSAAEQETPIMCFVGNSGIIQIHSGAVSNIKIVGDWLNVLDPEFNLHLLHKNVASAWLVRKPTVDGNITSLELFSAESEQIAQFNGVRQEGNTENLQWRALAESLLTEETLA